MTDISNLLTDGFAPQVTETESESTAGEPKRRYARRRKQRRQDKGLADDGELARLAEAYLSAVLKLFPERPLAVQPTPELIGEMVSDFKRRHRGEQAEADRFKDCRKASGGLPVAAIYARYSCENSKPSSIVDQVHNCLRKAAEQGRFVPWEDLKCTLPGVQAFPQQQENADHRGSAKN